MPEPWAQGCRAFLARTELRRIGPAHTGLPRRKNMFCRRPLSSMPLVLQDPLKQVNRGKISVYSICRTIPDCPGQIALRRSLDSLTFLPFNFEIERDFLATVKRRHRLYLGFRPFKSRMHLIIHVGIQPAESVVAIRIREAAAHRIGPQVF